MKALTVVLNVAVLSSVRVSCGRVTGRDANGTSSAVKDDQPGDRPWLPFFGINTFPFFSFSGLGLPQRPGLFAPDPVPIGDKIKATKTEYIEVTRRQTVHPVCYTMYENRAPCLPFKSDDNEDPEMDMEVYHHLTVTSDLGSPKSDEMDDYMKPVKEVLQSEREAKYLKFVKGRDTVKAVSKPVDLDGSETASIRGHTEYVTTTVLLTKLEKYTDHRVTATVVALNCLPADPMIQRCRKAPPTNPIVEVPILKNPNKGTIIITPAVRPRDEPQDDIEKTVEAVKKAAETVRAQVLDETDGVVQAGDKKPGAEQQ